MASSSTSGDDGRLRLDAGRAEPYRIDDLIRIMAALRMPVTGCPWDLEQDFRTIAPYTIEEAYEVADAIARGDMRDLRDELGDLLFQVAYHAQMAEEAGSFAFADVVDGICRKMVRRHPHVFGSEQVRAATEIRGLWDRVKAEEAAAKNRQAERPRTQSVIDGVPVALPALSRSVKLQDKAAKIGFDWPDVAFVFAKLKEEIGELEAEIAEGRRGAAAEEFGDVLFVVANLARHLQLDPEGALRAANQKFTRRFHHIEQRLREDGRPPENVTLEELDAWWDEAKATEKARK
jgi:MazG family protein